MLVKRLPLPQPRSLQYLFVLRSARAASTARFSTNSRRCYPEHDDDGRHGQQDADKLREGPARFSEAKDWSQVQPRRRFAAETRSDQVRAQSKSWSRSRSRSREEPARVDETNHGSRAHSAPKPESLPMKAKDWGQAQLHQAYFSDPVYRRKKVYGRVVANYDTFRSWNKTLSASSESPHSERATRPIPPPTWGAREQPAAKLESPASPQTAQPARVGGQLRRVPSLLARGPALLARPPAQPSTERAVRSRASRPPRNQPQPGPVEGSLFIPVDNELKKWLSMVDDGAQKDGDVDGETGKSKKDYDGHTVLVLKAASKSLHESDFYRLSRQGQHLEGWASGIFKIVQARSPVTREPQGQYFIFFESRAAARVYLEDAQKLHTLSRRVLPDQWRRPPTLERYMDPPRPATTDLLTNKVEDPVAAARAYTLLPPSAGLSLHEYSAEWVREEIKNHLAALREKLPGQEWRAKATLTHAPASGWYGVGANDTAQVKAVDPVVDYFAQIKSELYEDDQRRVLLHLPGGSMTPNALREAIDKNGHERRLAWRLEEGLQAVGPIEWTSEVAKEKTYFDDDWLRSEGETTKGEANVWREPSTPDVYSRFVLTFEDAVEAKRFVRIWHKKRIPNPRTERFVEVNATALW